MKNKFITFTTGSFVAAALLMAGTASAHTLALNDGLKLGLNANVENDHGDRNTMIQAGAHGNVNVHSKIDNDNDNDGSDGWKGHATSTRPVLFTGNGQPVIGGTVSAVNGDTLTVVTAAGITYSVNAASSTVVKGHATTTASTVAVGDKVLVQGAVNGTSITASSVIDSNTGTSTNNGTDGHNGFMFGLFGKVGGFFHSMFGFFK